MAHPEDNEDQADEAVNQILTWVNEQLAAGRSAADVKSDLVANDFSPSAAHQLVGAVQEARQRKPPLLSRIMGTVGGWVVLLIGFALLNGLLWGGQEILSMNEKREAAGLEARLDSLDREINATEARGRSVGLTASQQVAYEHMIDSYNALVPQYNEAADAAYSRWWLLPIPIPRSRGRAVN